MTGSTVICIIGPDGAGKSTQARKLIEVLQRRGIDCEYRWFGAHHLVSLPLLGYARLVGLSEVEQLESGRKIGYHYFWRSSVVSTLYPFLLLLDTFITYLFRIRLPHMVFGRTFVCDRFVHDIVVRVMLSTGDDEFHRSAVGRWFLQMVPERSTVFLLTADVETLRSRRDDVRQDETIERMVKLYDELATDLNIRRIDATDSPERIHEEILAQID